MKSNILIDEAGRARLADFGLLRIISDHTNLSYSTSLAQGGTVRWMSAELINPVEFGNEKSCPTQSSDCYALGMVIYETISGRSPFYGHEPPAVLVRVARGEHPHRGEGFPENLWEVLVRCWAHQPSDRPAVEEVLQELKAVPSLSEQPCPWLGEEMEDGDRLTQSNMSRICSRLFPGP